MPPLASALPAPVICEPLVENRRATFEKKLEFVPFGGRGTYGWRFSTGSCCTLTRGVLKELASKGLTKSGPPFVAGGVLETADTEGCGEALEEENLELILEIHEPRLESVGEDGVCKVGRCALSEVARPNTVGRRGCFGITGALGAGDNGALAVEAVPEAFEVARTPAAGSGVPS